MTTPFGPDRLLPRPIPPARWSARRLQRACLSPSGAELPFVAGLRHGPHRVAVFASHIQDVSSDNGRCPASA